VDFSSLITASQGQPTQQPTQQTQVPQQVKQTVAPAA